MFGSSTHEHNGIETPTPPNTPRCRDGGTIHNKYHRTEPYASADLNIRVGALRAQDLRRGDLLAPGRCTPRGGAQRASRRTLDHALFARSIYELPIDSGRVAEPRKAGPRATVRNILPCRALYSMRSSRTARTLHVRKKSLSSRISPGVAHRRVPGMPCRSHPNQELLRPEPASRLRESYTLTA